MNFEKLDEKTKEIINMYTTARQFKNAIDESEVIILKENKIINKIYPYIVNKSFACEIYLKLIIIINGETYKKIHTLKELYYKANISSEFEEYVLKNVKSNDIDYDLAHLNDDLASISNAFVDWRYVFTKKDLCISNGFLNIFCNYLDKLCVKLIIDKCDINMEDYTNI